ncbi:ATP-grasp domain-containing protein [Pseudomonas alliivorans]|nr:ATP-grasp domain-containing protein [Pseudomonas alliivorans]
MSVLLVEPRYFGLGYFQACKALGKKIIVLTSNIDDFKELNIVDLDVDVHEVDLNDSVATLNLVASLISAIPLQCCIAGSQFAVPIAGQISEKLGLPGLGVNSSLLGVNKDEARTQYNLHGVPSPKFFSIDNSTHLKESAPSLEFPVVIKPVASSSSFAVELAHTPEELLGAYERLKDINTAFLGFKAKVGFMVEEYVIGDEFSVELVLDKGCPIFSSVTEKWKTPSPYFVELAHIVPSNNSSNEELISTARTACKSLELHTGAFHVELILSDSGPKIVEVNPRPGGDKISTDLLPLALGRNVFEDHVRILCGLPPSELSNQQKKYSAIFFFSSNKSATMGSVDKLAELKLLPEIVEMVFYKKEGEAIVPPHSSEDRVGHVIMTANKREELVSLIDRIASEFNRTLIY